MERKAKCDVLALANQKERDTLNALHAELRRYRDQIADHDLQLESLRTTLALFESTYNARLTRERSMVDRVRSMVRHLEDWTDLVRSQPREELIQVSQFVENRREKELAPFQAERDKEGWQSTDWIPREEPIEDEPPPTRERYEELKSAYRQLARHYHPDFAQSEEERVRFSEIMRRINELYRDGDLSRLLALAEQHQVTDELLEETPVQEQLEKLRERARWFAAIVENLQEELHDLEQSEIFDLWQRAEQAKAAGRDLVAEIKKRLLDRLDQLYDEVGWAIGELEQTVVEYNKTLSTEPPAIERRSNATDIERVFDPFADKGLVRLGLEALDTRPKDRTTRRRADWIIRLADEAPAQLRIILLAHVSQLSKLPLPGLESYEDLRLRFDALCADDEAPITLEHTLAQMSDIVEYGVRRASPQLVHLGLRFRSEGIRNAVPLALQAAPVRHELKRVLWVLGEEVTCDFCHSAVFAIPLFYTRGLDDLRASVCPSCGETIRRYYLPKGDDIQAVLNPVYVDLDIISDWSFRLSRASVATQLLPVQVANFTVGELKKRLVTDLFGRYELGLSRGQIAFFQGPRRIKEKTPLYELPEQKFTVRFKEGAPLTESDALEMLRYRIRHKFK